MSDTAEHGVIAAGHPLTAQAGAEVLRAGGNAVDAAVAAMLMSFAAEPLLTGLGAGGHMLVAGAGEQPVLLDFFVQAPARRQDGGAAELDAVDVSFGDAVQVFHIGPASCGVYGTPAGVCAAVERWGTMPLQRLSAPAARAAREGVTLNAGQAYIAEILADLLTSTPECAALWAPEGHVLREGEPLRNPELGDALDRLGADGAEPFYRGDIAQRGVRLAGRARGLAERRRARLLPRDRARARAGLLPRSHRPHQPTALRRGNAAGLLARAARPRSTAAAPADVLVAMESAQAERTPEFVEGLAQDGFLERFLAAKLGSTTHISVLDRDGRACSVTCTNGEGSGVVVPGTGIHVNNVMGEEDLNPLGFHRHPAGRRMPSMMAPSIVLSDGAVELVLGSAGSNRIRSAILQTIVGVVDHGLGAREAVDAPRVHFEDGIVYHEPGLELPAAPASDPDPRGRAFPRAEPVLRRRPGGAAAPAQGSRARAIPAGAASR